LCSKAVTGEALACGRCVGKSRAAMERDVLAGLDQTQLSKQISWVLRRGARQSGCRIDEKGWVQVQDMLACKYFDKYSEQTLLAIVEKGNKQKKRYEIQTVSGMKMVRAVGDKANVSNHQRPTFADKPSMVPSDASTTASSPPGSTVAESGVASARHQFSWHEGWLNADAAVLSPSLLDQTPVGRRVGAPFDVTPGAKQLNPAARPWNPMNSTLDSAAIVGKHNVAFDISKLLLDAFDDSRQSASPSSCSTAPAPPDGFFDAPIAWKPSLRAPSLLRSSSNEQAGVAGDDALAEESTHADTASMTAFLSVELHALTGGEVLSDSELERRARESLTEAGFGAEDILRASLNERRTACQIEVSFASRDPSCEASVEPVPIMK